MTPGDIPSWVVELFFLWTPSCVNSSMTSNQESTIPVRNAHLAAPLSPFLPQPLLFLTFCVAVIVLSLSHVRFFETPWTAARRASLSFTISQSLLKPLSIEPVMPSNHLILCHPLLLPSVFPKESTLCIRWPKYRSFSFNVSPSDEYSELFPLGLTGLILQSKGLSRVF